MNAQDIYLIYAGGTFGSHGVPLSPLPASVFLPVLQTLLNDKLTSTQHILPNDVVKDSSGLTPSDFVHFYELIKHAYKQGARRFVLMTGTDSLSFVSAFLANAFMNLEGLSLVITGSMHPLLIADQLPYRINDDSDAWVNLSNAITTTTQSTGVWVQFYGQGLPACNTQKLHSHDVNAFVGGKNYTHTQPHVFFDTQTLKQKALTAHIQSVYLLPNDSQFVAQTLATQTASMIILIAFGAGNLIKNDELIKTLEDLHAKGTCVVCTTMCALGGVSTTYQAGSWQYDHHVWSGEQLSVAGIYGRLLWLYLTDSLTHDNWNAYE